MLLPCFLAVLVDHAAFEQRLTILPSLTRARRALAAPFIQASIGLTDFIEKNLYSYDLVFKRFSKIITEKRYVLIEKQ